MDVPKPTCDGSFCIWDSSKYEEWCSKNIDMWIGKAVTLLQQMKTKQVKTEIDITKSQSSQRYLPLLTTHPDPVQIMENKQLEIKDMDVALIVLGKSTTSANTTKTTITTELAASKAMLYNGALEPLLKVCALVENVYSVHFYNTNTTLSQVSADSVVNMVLSSVTKSSGRIIFEVCTSTELFNDSIYSKINTDFLKNSQSPGAIGQVHQIVKSLCEISDDQHIEQHHSSAIAELLTKYDQQLQSPIYLGESFIFPEWAHNTLSAFDIHVTAKDKQWHNTMSFKINISSNDTHRDEVSVAGTKIKPYIMRICTRVSASNSPFMIR